MRNLWRRVLAALAMIGGRHRYLSTACLHDACGHCRSTTAADGRAKVPGTCKFCSAVCVCECHRRTRREATE